MKTGTAELYLHGGKAPPWLFSRMTRLGSSMMTVMVDEYGRDEVLRRLSNPFFFQSLSNVLGFDWNSSGTTTVLCGVLQTIFKSEDLGVAVVGGKGNSAHRFKEELITTADRFSLSEKNLYELRYASKISAKVDTSMIQAGYPLYHHSLFVTEDAKWAVVQQGMNSETRLARRYHWLSNDVKDFVEEPHEGIVGDVVHDNVLDLTSKDSRGTRDAITDIARESPVKTKEAFDSIVKEEQRTLKNWDATPLSYAVPKRMNWSAVEDAYELQPRNFEGMLNIEGIGPATVRGLTLIADLIYGEEPSWRDPVRYSFCVGGKDGVPYPIDRKHYDETIETLKNAVENARIGKKDQLGAIKRLSNF